MKRLLPLVLLSLLLFPSSAAADTLERSNSISYIAHVLIPTPVRTEPNGRRKGKVQPLTQWGNLETRLMVLRARNVNGRLWLQVRLPVRPNNANGWISAEAVQLERTRYRIHINRSSRTVSAYYAGRLVRRFRAVIGSSSTPTPGGLFAIQERQRQPIGGFVGPWALHLTAFSNVLENFGGGPGRVAIHGRDGASFADPLGSARSHGCIRVNNNHINWMATKVPVGTPVIVN